MEPTSTVEKKKTREEDEKNGAYKLYEHDKF